MSCLTGKVTYATRGEARRAAQSIAAAAAARWRGSKPSRPRGMSPYRCKVCGHWHLTGRAGERRPHKAVLCLQELAQADRQLRAIEALRVLVSELAQRLGDRLQLRRQVIELKELQNVRDGRMRRHEPSK